MKWRKLLVGLGFCSLAVAAYFVLTSDLTEDRLGWPTSGEKRIVRGVELVKEIKGPYRSCYMTRNSLAIRDRDELSACTVKLEPVSDPIEVYPRGYIKQFYRGDHGDLFCEYTMSTFFGNDRIVGSDCYYGLFRKKDDTGIGMTDDPFG